MPCATPIRVWRGKEPNPDTGRFPLVFKGKQAAQVEQDFQIPCGKCLACKSARANAWGVRMYHEASLHPQNCFLTLTYENPPRTIVKRDLQLFFKRVRKHGLSLRYYAVGEYGDQTRRPHYHAAIFGHDFRGGSFNINDQLYSSPVISRLWGLGQVAIADLSLDACMYIAGYVQKKAGDDDTFSLMSTRPGIGHAWLDKYHDDLARTGTVTVQGREYAIPPAYLRKLESFQSIATGEEYLGEVKRARKIRFENMDLEERARRAESAFQQNKILKSRVEIKKLHRASKI